MKDYEKKICEEIYPSGCIVEAKSFVCDGIDVESYTVDYEGHNYIMTKHNGQWIYCHRTF